MASEIAQRVADKLIAIQKRALVVYTGSTINFADSLESLRKLKGEGFTYSVFLSPSAAALLDVAAIREALEPENLWLGTTDQPPEALATSYHTVLVPCLTINTASHIAACMPDSPASRIVTNAMWRGKNVVINIDGCCPDFPGRAAKGYRMTEPLKAYLRENLAKIQAFGATLTSARGMYAKTMKVIGNLAAAKAEGKPMGACAVSAKPAGKAVRVSAKVLGNGHVMGCPAGGTLVVSKGTVVTQLAKEAAAQRGVKIVQE